MAKVNYTVEDTEKLLKLYAELGTAGLDEIAKEFPGKSVNSIRSKLVKEGVYVAAEKKVAMKKNEGPSKKDLIAKLVEMTGRKFTGIEGATKGAIAEVIELFEEDEVEQEVQE